eukprot:4313173-Heterocapsa_arctica.AAC.1
MNAEPQCLWTTGVITKEWTALEETYMKQHDFCQPCTEHTKKVYVDGSATKTAASAYAGWGMWSPDNPNFKDNGALIRERPRIRQSSGKGFGGRFGTNPLEALKLSLTTNMSETPQTTCLQ